MEDTFEDWGAECDSFFAAHRHWPEPVQNLRAKIVIGGDPREGKTSLVDTAFLKRDFVQDEDMEYNSSPFLNVEVEFDHDELGNGCIELWDQSFQEGFESLRRLSYPGTDILVMAYSTAGGLRNIRDKWLPEVVSEIGREGFVIVLVRTKADVPTDDELNYAGLEVAREIGASAFVETSCKENRGLDMLVALLVELVCMQASAPRSNWLTAAVQTEPRYIGVGSRKLKTNVPNWPWGATANVI